MCASHTAFLVLKRRQFYLSHLPAYFSDVSKRSLLAAPTVCSDFLFAEADVARLLSDTQTSSLRSQQALVDYASCFAGARPCRSSPRCSPAHQSPGHRRRESGSPTRSSKRVRFDSPAPSSALKSSKRGFRRYGSCPSPVIRGCLGQHWRLWESWGADRWVVEVLWFGYWVPILVTPSLSGVPIPLPSYSTSSIGIGSERCGGGSLHEGSNRTGSPFSWLVQPPLCYPKGHRGLAACNRPLPSQQVC